MFGRAVRSAILAGNLGPSSLTPQTHVFGQFAELAFWTVYFEHGSGIHKLICFWHRNSRLNAALRTVKATINCSSNLSARAYALTFRTNQQSNRTGLEGNAAWGYHSV